ncbi:hypothetical protein RGU72_04695 [Undibacterium sp. 5I1]|uniref:hypothetical protein n=1 Tax=unclassified Undibacterium TaxID=2630295 RepID=UPI002AB46924|nr:MULTISPECIES: hypothetical protein [unclassified Undibacterium]MDY7537550.1 hypothetical protein [Undibacterium sp. 5I1]MEB0231935.1 hypothetical protein [Undibacterium sp. 10I3]MEB0256286.1 hypothetical protein [Undibacterium sp. 5I1]
MSDVPVLREELDRKSLETAQWLLNSFQNHSITAEQFSTGLDTLFMAVSGLVDEELIDLITACDQYTKNLNNVVKAHFCKDRFTHSVTWKVGETSLLIEKRQDGSIYDEETKHFGSAEIANKAMQLIENNYIKSGCEKL